MSAIKEVELKLFIDNSINNVLNKIGELGWSAKGEENQEDIYYTSAYKDFIKTEECLRIRDFNGKCELTWKPPTTLDMQEKKQFWKQEVDLRIDGQKEIAITLLKNLEFIEYVVVKKRRIKFQIDDISNVSLDFIDTLGWFVEIETMSADEILSIKK